MTGVYGLVAARSIRCRCGEELDVETLRNPQAFEDIVATRVKRWSEPKGDFVVYGQGSVVEDTVRRRDESASIHQHIQGFVSAWHAMHQTCREVVDDPMVESE